MKTTPSFPAPDKRRRPGPARSQFSAAPTATAMVADPAIAALVEKVDPGKLSGWVNALALMPTRHSLSPQSVEAAKWLKDQFVGLGYADTLLQDFAIGSVTRHNVVCTKIGSVEPSRFILVGAHFDSRMSDLQNSNARAPGADDNASGTAALLELARLLHAVDVKCSVRLVAFSGKEQGLVGSTAYAENARAIGENIGLMINLDMIGHPH